VKSPCIGICRLEHGRCVGCHRTGDQIARWAYMTDEERETITGALEDTSGTEPDPEILRPRESPLSSSPRRPDSLRGATILEQAAASERSGTE